MPPILNLSKHRRRIQSDDEAAVAFNAAQADLRYALFRLCNSGCRASLDRALISSLLRMESAGLAVCDQLAHVQRKRAQKERVRKKEAASRE